MLIMEGVLDVLEVVIVDPGPGLFFDRRPTRSFVANIILDFITPYGFDTISLANDLMEAEECKYGIHRRWGIIGMDGVATFRRRTCEELGSSSQGPLHASLVHLPNWDTTGNQIRDEKLT